MFYDGTPHLNAIHVDCNTLSTLPQACVNNGSCGWCGDKNSCIPGTFNGPLAPCLKSTYIFNAPNDHWNPIHAGTININTTNNDKSKQLVVTSHPDFERASSKIYN